MVAHTCVSSPLLIIVWRRELIRFRTELENTYSLQALQMVSVAIIKPGAIRNEMMTIFSALEQRSADFLMYIAVPKLDSII